MCLDRFGLVLREGGMSIQSSVDLCCECSCWSQTLSVNKLPVKVHASLNHLHLKLSGCKAKKFGMKVISKE